MIQSCVPGHRTILVPGFSSSEMNYRANQLGSTPSRSRQTQYWLDWTKKLYRRADRILSGRCWRFLIEFISKNIVFQFIRRNDHSIISIDRLECFRSAPEAGNVYRVWKKNYKQYIEIYFSQSSVLSVLKALSKMSSFVIGMSRVEEITPAVAEYFPVKICINNLDNFSKIGVFHHSVS